MRQAAVASKNLGMLENVPDASDCVDEWDGAIVIHLAAQAIDVDIDYVRCGINPHAPDVIQNHGASNDTPSIPAKIFQEGELLRGQLEQALATSSLMTHKVKLQVRSL